MLDIKFVRENPKVVKENQKKRGLNTKIVDEVLEFDKKWRNSLQNLEKLRHKRNVVSGKIAEMKGERKKATKEIREMKKVVSRISKLEENVKKYKEKRDQILMRIPNILHKTVPKGKDETENVPIRHWGKMPKFGFKPKNHLDIAINLGLMDPERAAKVSGMRFFYLKKDLVLLDYALMRYAMDFLIKRGFTPIEPPFMMRRKPYEGVTDLGDFESVMYKAEGEDLYLIATSEHPMAALYMNEVLTLDQLPIKLVGISPCFRKEVGSHGKYTKGLFRMHQFNKVEQFVFCHPDDSWKIHEELQKNSEDMFKELGIPYRVVNVCTGDIGIVAAKKYDIEMLMTDKKYREVGSNSNCTNYQAVRLNIKYREKEGAPPIDYVHTLNNTGIATSRVMIAILEMNQQKDGSVIIPKVLRSYMNGKKVIEKK